MAEKTREQLLRELSILIPQVSDACLEWVVWMLEGAVLEEIADERGAE